MNNELPKETWVQISGYLDRVSLLNVASTSSRLRTAAHVWLFETIQLHINDSETSSSEVDGWTAILDQTSSLQHVRNLTITGGGPHNPPRPSESANVRTVDSSWDTTYHLAGSYETSHLLTNDHYWMPVRDFIQNLVGLRFVKWGHFEQVPPCVLREVQDCTRRNSAVRLQINSFMLRSMCQLPPNPPTLDSYEREIATSPSLNSLVIEYDRCRDDGCLNFNEEAIMELIQVNPNLRRVAMTFEFAFSTPKYNATMRAPDWPEWQRGTMGQTKGALGELTHLHISFPTRMGELLRELSTKTDFSKLVTLRLVGSLESEDVKWLNGNTSCHLTSLRALSVCLGSSFESSKEETTLQNFFESIGSLRNLELTGFYTQATFESVLKRHGPTLERLFLKVPRARLYEQEVWMCSHQTQNLLGESCPKLEELKLPIVRHAGDSRERETYRLIASIPKLQRVYLSVHFLPMAMADHKRDILINATVDEHVANFIFNSISGAKPAGQPLFEFIELTSKAVTRFNYDFAASDLFKSLTRSWVCKLSPRNDSGEQYAVEEMDLNSDKEQPIWGMPVSDQKRFSTLGKDMQSLVHDIWPEANEHNWKKAMHGFPSQKPEHDREVAILYGQMESRRSQADSQTGLQNQSQSPVHQQSQTRTLFGASM